MENEKLKNNVNETEEKVETIKEENINKVEVKKNLEEPKGNSYAFLIIVFILLIVAVIVMPMILNR